MLPRVWIFLGFLLGVLSAFSQPEPAIGRVLFFPDPNYRGDPLIIEAGQSQPNLHSARQSNRQRWNDSISSVRIEGPVRAIVYGDADFNGERLELKRDLSDLTVLPHGVSKLETWDDRISSIKVEALSGFAGPSQNAPAFKNQREADRAIHAAYRDLLGRDPDNDGLQNYRRRLLDQGWTDARLRDEVRKSPEFRGRDFDGIVRRGYAEILGREPDPSGLASYRQRMRDGMSEGDFRATLKRSPEAKDRINREIVKRAFKDILGREPDDGGMNTYLRLMRDNAWSEQRVRDTLKNSDEYKNKPR